MKLLIDGNNVLCTTMPPSLAGLVELDLCRLVAASGLAEDGATVVCDGVQRGRGDPALAANGVELVYSGAGRAADSVILDRIERDTAPRRLIVVSSDREIQRAAGRRRAGVWDSPRFLHELVAALAAVRQRRARIGPGKLQTGTLGEVDVARWAREFGLDPNQEVDPPQPPEFPDATDDA
jgi:predicted RNA-binding protein with PIN domain